MNRQKVVEPWRVALNDLKDRTPGATYKGIGDKIHEPERTVYRVFTGDTKNPGVDLIRRIISALGGSMAEVFGEGGAYIASQDIVNLQIQYDELKASYDRLLEENKLLQTKNAELTDELLSVVNYFIKNKPME